MKKWLKILGISFITGCFLAFLALHFFGASMLVYPMRIETEGDFITNTFGEHAIPINIYGEDSIRLDSYHIINETNINGTFIICHGIGSCKEHQVNLVSWLNQFGFNTFLFDSRAHGKSEGEFCTYGYNEKKDISKIVSYLKAQGETPYILGTSLGGAVALQAMSYDQNIEGGIILSTFSDLKEVSLSYQKRLTKIGWHWVNDYVLSRAEKLANFEVDSVRPIESCSKINKPVFIAHGKKDVHIDYHCAERNYNALKSTKKELYLVNEADHNNLFQKGGDAFNNALNSFIKANF